MPQGTRCSRWYLTWQLKDGVCPGCLETRRYRGELPQTSPLRCVNRWEKLAPPDMLAWIRAGKPYIALDTETTGLEPDQDAIIEIGAVRMEQGKETDRFSTLVHSARLLPQVIRELTGIDDAMLADAPEMGQVIRAFADFLGDLPVAAHNAAFDLQFLCRAGEDFGVDLGKPAACDTVRLGRQLFPELENHKLGTLMQAIGYVNEHAHRATDDAMAVAALLEYAAQRPEMWKEE